MPNRGEVRPVSTPTFEYPAEERERHGEATIAAAFVIDRTGAIEYSSITFLSPAAVAFERSVCRQLRTARFAPIMRDGTPQRALVLMPFAFTLSPGVAPEQYDWVAVREQWDREGVPAVAARLETGRHCPP